MDSMILEVFSNLAVSKMLWITLDLLHGSEHLNSTKILPCTQLRVNPEQIQALILASLTSLLLVWESCAARQSSKVTGTEQSNLRRLFILVETDGVCLCVNGETRITQFYSRGSGKVQHCHSLDADKKELSLEENAWHVC